MGNRKKFHEFHLEMEKLRDRESTQAQRRLVNKTGFTGFRIPEFSPDAFHCFYFQYLVELLLESHQVKEFLSFKNRFVGAAKFVRIIGQLTFMGNGFHIFIF